MAGTLSAVKTFCQYSGWNDSTTAGLSQLETFISDTVVQLCELMPWPEYYSTTSTTFTADTDSSAVTGNRIGSVIRSTRSTPLEEIELDKYLLWSTYNAGTGEPNYYALKKSVSSGAVTTTMYIYPKPTADTTLYYTYYLPATSVTSWPNERDWLLYEALKARLASRDRDSAGHALYSADFMAKAQRAFNQARPSLRPIIAKPEYFTKPGKWRLNDINKTITS